MASPQPGTIGRWVLAASVIATLLVLAGLVLFFVFGERVAPMRSSGHAVVVAVYG